MKRALERYPSCRLDALIERGVRFEIYKEGPVKTDAKDIARGGDGPDAPITFENGKRCWINKVVFHMPDGPAQLLPNPDPAQRQVFAAGDSDTDIAFVKDATSLKLALNRNKTELMCNAYANAGGKWVVQPMFIGPKSQKTAGYACSSAKDAAGNPIVDENGQPIADQTDSVFTLGQ